MTELEQQGELGPLGPPVGRHATTAEVSRRAGAGILSSLVPGLGHLILRAPIRAAVWFLLACCATYLWWGLRLPHVLTGLLLATAVNLALWLFAGADALLGMRNRLPQAPRGWLAMVAVIAVVASLFASDMLAKASGFHHFHDTSNAMENTILNGETVVVDSHAYRDSPPKPGDIIIFVRNGSQLVRRVIATGGTTVQGRNGSVLLNGAAIPEPYAAHRGPSMPNIDNFPATQVPEGEYFVAGDNRDQALDSRMPDFGLVTDQAVVGRPIYVLQSNSILRIGRAIR